jgi:hypothetical protein
MDADQPLSGLGRNYPAWRPETLPNYDTDLLPACMTVLDALTQGTSQDRLAFVLDPRNAHAALYRTLTPPSYPEYAGTYRGTPGTSLEARMLTAMSQTGGPVQPFSEPEFVHGLMNGVYATLVKQTFATAGTANLSTFVGELTNVFYWLGRIHPFLDGNGHIQRLVFLAGAIERGAYPLARALTVHPNGFGLELAEALEQDGSVASLRSLQALLGSYLP